VVEDTLWGFDGTVVPGRFGTLHAWVRNHGKDPFEGVIRLSRVGFAGAEQGLPLVVACYIAAGTERGVEFVVRVEDLSAATWELSWDEPRAMRASIQAPRQGAPATVILERGRFRPVQRSQFRGFAEERFPPSVAMTEALGAVILDHAPVFEEVRAQAFVDWIRAGGVVHVARNAAGHVPRFTGKLSPLSEALRSGHLGQGRVFVHGCTLGELDPGMVDAVAGPRPSLQSSDSSLLHDPDAALLRHLGKTVRREHNWTLMFLMAGVYALLIFLLPPVLTRRLRSPVYPASVLFAAIVLFSWWFERAGRRGYTSDSGVCAFALAEQVGGARYAVTQWCQAFARRGATYRLRFSEEDCSWQAFDSAGEVEAVRGLSIAGRQGYVALDLPVCSRRAFMGRAVLRGPPLRVDPIDPPASGGVAGGAVDPLAPGVAFRVSGAEGLRVREGMLVDGDTVVTLEWRDGVLVPTERVPFEQFLSPEAVHRIALRGYPFSASHAEGTDPGDVTDSVLRAMSPVVIGAATGGSALFMKRLVDPGAGPQLFVLADLPPSFGLSADPELGTAQGLVLFRLRLRHPQPGGFEDGF
jgi:hypothetical protein